jgi:hypothetical protein
MSNREDIQKFIEEFKLYASVFDIFVVDTDKNINGLLDFGITAIIRKEIILDLELENYFRGPNRDRDRPQLDVWEFGYKLSKTDEIYIKLSTRREKQRAVCLSFHRAEFQINYPYELK